MKNRLVTERERKLRQQLEEKQKEIEKLRRFQEKNLQDLQEANTVIDLLSRKMEKNTKEKELEIARQLERKVLSLCPSLKEEGKKKEILDLEVDILTFQIRSLVGELIQGTRFLNLLTACEMHVAALIARGCTSREIANQLFVSESTVKTHRKNIRGKLGLRNKRKNLAKYLLEIM